jgi:hypothetical protein
MERRGDRHFDPFDFAQGRDEGTRIHDELISPGQVDRPVAPSALQTEDPVSLDSAYAVALTALLS